MSFGESRRPLAAIEHDQAVGDLMDMGEIVLDVDAGAAGLFDAPHEVDDLAHLGDAQRGGRFVEDDEVGVEMHRAPDGDALALAARQIGDGRIDGDADAAKADDVDQDLLRDLLLALDVDEAEAVGDLPADEEVAPQRLLLGERLVLIDGLDRQLMRHAHRIVGEVDRLSRTKMRPDVGGITPVITLISVDLPAPLSPIRPTISLRPIARLMFLSACTAPKYFCTPSRRTIFWKPLSTTWTLAALFTFLLPGSQRRLPAPLKIV